MIVISFISLHLFQITICLASNNEYGYYPESLAVSDKLKSRNFSNRFEIDNRGCFKSMCYTGFEAPGSRNSGSRLSTDEILCPKSLRSYVENGTIVEQRKPELPSHNTNQKLPSGIQGPGLRRRNGMNIHFTPNKEEVNHTVEQYELRNEKNTLYDSNGGFPIQRQDNNIYCSENNSVQSKGIGQIRHRDNESSSDKLERIKKFFCVTKRIKKYTKILFEECYEFVRLFLLPDDSFEYPSEFQLDQEELNRVTYEELENPYIH